MPEPPVIEEILARMKLARTPLTERAWPAVTVEVSMVEYCASASIIADCKTTLIAEGAVPKIVCQRTVCPFQGSQRSWAERTAGWPVLRRALRS